MLRSIGEDVWSVDARQPGPSVAISTRTVSSRLVVALPLRMVDNSRLVLSTAFRSDSFVAFVMSDKVFIGLECRRVRRVRRVQSRRLG